METLDREPYDVLHADPATVVPLPIRTARSMTSSEVRVALIGNYAPRKCGIATFTTDLHQQLHAFHPEIAIDLYALQDREDPVVHSEPCFEIDRDDPASYASAARRMNEDGVDAVWIQHEFGIFGGDCGEDVLGLIDRIAAPLIVTMHTVLAEPNPKQEQITRAFLARASYLMVMSDAGRQVLIERYGADRSRVAIIEHGAPDRPLQLSGRKASGTPMTLMTFGLLGPGKGLETAIAALPAIVARHPETIYRIAGVEHPNELRRNGESYRQKLIEQARQLGVADNIEWVNRFLETDELIALIQECDIYLTPYPNLDQSTSGTLSYAVALGRAVISTPYVHAREVLSDIGGVLVPVGDAEAIAREANRLLDNRDELDALQLRTYRRGRDTIWLNFAANAKALLERAVHTKQPPTAAAEFATPGLAAFDAICDGTGILQHAIHIVPDRNHGYCLDDNARALMLVHRVAWDTPHEGYRRASTFASFVQHAWNRDEHVFRNFMNYDRTWCETCGSEDSNGRAIWALGDAARHAVQPALRLWAIECFDRYAPIALKFGAARSLAFAALGSVAVLAEQPGHGLAVDIVNICGRTLETLLGGARRPDWTWFESVVGYDNPRLSEALIECGRVTGNADWIALGLDTLRWIMQHQTSARGFFRPVGSETFGCDGEFLPFDQQPLEAWAAIEACAVAHRADGDNAEWLEHARRAYRWFFGENDRGALLVDLQTGSCLDGVTPHGPNLNVGAESLLAFQLAYYSFTRLLGRVAVDWRDDAAERHTHRIR